MPCKFGKQITIKMTKRFNSGFTIIELAIVLVIISLLVVGALNGLSLTRGAKINNAISLAQDLSVAVNTFKKQYRLLPGDLGITVANPEIPNVRAECRSGGNNGGTNNGLIDASESKCVPEVLLKSGLVKVEQDDGWPVFRSNFGLVNVVGTAQSNIPVGFLPSVTHVVEFQNLPCDVAQEIDRKIDNDDLASGKAISTNCLPTNIVAFYAVALL